MNRSDVLRPAFLVLWAVLAIAGYYLMSEMGTMIICVIAAVTLAAAVAPAARRMERHKVPRVVTVIAIYAAIALLYSGVAYNLSPVISTQSRNLIVLLREKVQPWVLHKWHDLLPDEEAGEMLDGGEGNISLKTSIKNASMDMRSQIMGKAGNLATSALKLTGSLMSFAVNIVFVLFLTAYFVVESGAITSGLLRWLPGDKRERVRALLPGLELRLGGYVRGQILVSLAVGTIIGAGLALVGIKEALVLGVVAGLLNLVPFVGSMITAVFAIVIGFNQGLSTGLFTILVFVVEQWLESNFIVPHLLGKQVDMHPLVVLFSVLIGGTLLGLPGALIAVPVAAVVLYLAEELYLKPLDASSPSISSTASGPL